MKSLIYTIGAASKVIAAILLGVTSLSAMAQYVASPEVERSQREFAADRFGIFIHWGIYSMFGQGEWYLNYGPLHEEYAKAARGFYPADFDAGKWADAIKGSGAKYVCFTTRHHDGFSMWDTDESDYNIVKSTPFKRDVLKELSDSLSSRELKLHLYYSHIDWGRDDYPRGRTGKTTGVDSLHYDWPNYYGFMNRQLKELLTRYGKIRAIWFDGWWDHDEDTIPFNWQLPEQYALVHSLQPGVMVANNHHQDTFEGEDIQIFERDVPGENHAGYSEQAISTLPLETCQTMNGIWGYRVCDQNYKSTAELVRLLVKTAGMNANLLLNIGPQPNGELPATALERLREMGQWLEIYGETIYGTQGNEFGPQPWGTSTRKPGRRFVHIITAEGKKDFIVPVSGKVTAAKVFGTGEKVKFTHSKDRKSVSLSLPSVPDSYDFIVELTEI